MLHRTEILAQARPVGEDRYEVSVDDHFDPDAALALWSETSAASVYNHPAWWQAALESFGPHRRIAAVSVRHAGQLCAYWPFWEKRLGPKDAFVRALEPVGSRASDYVMPLIAPGHDSPALIAAMLNALQDELSPRTLILWSKADDVDAADAAIGQSFASSHTLVHRRIRRCPGVTLPGSYEELESRWSSKRRAQLRRRMRRLKELGELSLFVAETREEIRARLPVFIAMHKANWGARSAASEFETPANVRFIEQIAAELPMELLHYSEARAGEVTFGAAFDFRHGSSLLGYKAAFNIEYRSYSPGMVHIALNAEWACENGFKLFDFMQGEEPYKFNMADHTGETVSHAIASPVGLPVWFWNTKLRDLIIEYKV